ncbi:phospholipase D family protein [Halorhodospira sp. 9621]|uniref:phospholipase D family protein n=1 Tax=Halorhodospira sp. 9621 TaxID=2899135 RepID=UPI001EE92E66|nr:phospholipase D family protein [Halorhodospira sp. 9621]MCG5534019.1 phospholipase D family protein [Halorhodospira sp. 9621]
MLSPDARQVATEVLRPPAGYTLDRTVLTSYSLDLEVVLALPLAVLAQSDRGVEELLEDPLLLLEALREASGRVQVFVDASGIALPRVQRELYAALEASVHPVRAPGQGVFHPKVWVARFTGEQDGRVLLRVAVASRNLTFDRSWDVALVSEAEPGAEAEPGSEPLAALVRDLPGLAVQPLARPLTEGQASLAEELGRTRFPAPEGFDGAINFHVLGLGGPGGAPWRPVTEADRVLAVAPFVDRHGLHTLAASGSGSLALIGRDEALDALPEGTLAPWEDVQVLQETALEEPQEDTGRRPAGLHAKLIAAERGGRAHWWVGSANLTHAALSGRNVEVLASLAGEAGSAEAEHGVGIDRFRAGLDKLCTPYEPGEAPADGEAEARRALERARDELLQADLAVHCEAYGSEWRWRLAGELPEPEGVAIDLWPVTLPLEQARTWPAEPAWTLPLERLTAFVAFRLRGEEGADPVTGVAKLPAHGLPEERMRRILRTVINTPERLLAFLRALLGGLDELMEGVGEGATADPDSLGRGRALEAETLLEDLLRTAARDPERLDVVRHVITDLMADEEGRAVVPEQVRAIWRAVDEALQGEARR